MFYSRQAQDLIDSLYAAMADGTVKQKLRALGKLDLIAIDGLGYLPMDDTAGNHLFQLVSSAYERQRLIVTSNRPFEEWVPCSPIRRWPVPRWTDCCTTCPYSHLAVTATA